MNKKIRFFVLAFSFLTLFFLVNFAFAQDFGLTEVESGLDGSLVATDDIRVVAGRFIQLALSFLGVIAVLLVIYAGFLWMTSGGNEEKISVAKKILKNAVIGLIIILASWGITTFIINRVRDTLTGAGGTSQWQSTPSGFYNPGIGALGACSVESIYPEDGQKDVPRNTSIMITFKEEIDLSSVCISDAGLSCACDNNTCNKLNPENIRIFKNDLGDACAGGSCPAVNSNVSDVLVSVPNDKKTLVLSPLSYLGSSTGHTPYSVRFTDRIKKTGGVSMFSSCSSNYLEVTFTISNVLDLEPPIVLQDKIVPRQDNEKDLYGESVSPVSAIAEIKVNACPEIYSKAEVLSISPSGPEVSFDNYTGQISIFKISIPSDNTNKAQLFNGLNNSLLGIADFNSNNEVFFADYKLKFKTETRESGNIWEIKIKPERLADTLRVNSMVYTFSSVSGNNNIAVLENCNSLSPSNLESQAFNIKAVLSGHPDIELENSNGSLIKLKSRVAGISGNSIVLSASNPSSLSIKPFTGGLNKIDLSEVKDKPDRPRNSAIQINFNEPINPLTVSGSADEVSNFIRVVNFRSDSLPSGSSCSANSDCKSFKCDNSICVGDYVNGRFMVSNRYRTVEFLSNEECGVNACGDKIYCLPANSNLKVELQAANLKTCSNNNDCAALSPFNSCSSVPLGYNVCQNLEGKNYPSANIANLDGIIDAATNSLDGNRNTSSQGPLSFYNENNPSIENGDNYSWSFFVSDKINLDPPRITYIGPGQGSSEVEPASPIDVYFNTLMLNSTLISGSTDIRAGSNVYNHKFINLRSSAPAAFGYWINSENKDIEPFDGEPDMTIATIGHTPLPESMTFYAQVGSGVRDIYQNCFKPSIGPGCSEVDGSCCFGESTTELDSSGNCRL